MTGLCFVREPLAALNRIKGVPRYFSSTAPFFSVIGTVGLSIARDGFRFVFFAWQASFSDKKAKLIMPAFYEKMSYIYLHFRENVIYYRR